MSQHKIQFEGTENLLYYFQQYLLLCQLAPESRQPDRRSGPRQKRKVARPEDLNFWRSIGTSGDWSRASTGISANGTPYRSRL